MRKRILEPELTYPDDGVEVIFNMYNTAGDGGIWIGDWLQFTCMSFNYMQYTVLGIICNLLIQFYFNQNFSLIQIIYRAL